MITEKIKKLSARDRLILIEEIWDTLYREADDIESPEWHKDVLQARQKRINNGETTFKSVDDLKAKNQ